MPAFNGPLCGPLQPLPGKSEPETSFAERRGLTGMKHFLAAVVIMFACQAQAAGWKGSPRVGELFKTAGVDGTFVLYDAAAQTYMGHDKDRAEKRFLPDRYVIGECPYCGTKLR